MHPVAEPQQYDADIQEKEVLSLRCTLYDERDVRLCTRTAGSVQLSWFQAIRGTGMGNLHHP